MPWFWSLLRGRVARSFRATTSLSVTRLEDRLAPAALHFATDPGRSFFAYDPAFAGGVNVAVGDVTGDGVPDVVSGAGAGGGPHVRAFDGVTGREVRSFFAYDPGFRGGVNVAVEGGLIVTGAGAGGGPHVKAFDVASGREVLSFFAYDPGFHGGVSVGAGGGFIVTGAGPGGGPHVKVFDATTGRETKSFFAYDPAFRGGVNVAGGANQIVTAAGPGGGPHVKVFDATTGRETKSFMAYELAFRGGVNVALGDATGDGVDDITTGAMAGGGPRLQVFDGLTGEDRVNVFAYDPGFTGGVSVAVGWGLLATGAGPGGGPHVRQFGLPAPTLSPPLPPALPQVPPPLPVVPPVPLPGNFPADLAGWDPLILGGSGEGRGSLTVENGVLVLREGDSFRVGLSRAFTVPAAPTAVRVTYERPAFDTASVDRIKDAFEVAVLGADGSPLALPIAADRDSSFNLTEQLDPVVSADTTHDPGSTIGVITVNLSALPAGTAATLVLRLVNDDTDQGTSVRVRRVEFVTAGSPAPAGRTPPPDRVKPAVAPDLTTLSDVTPSAQLAYGLTTLTDERTVLTADVSVRNAGTYPLAGRLVVALGNLSDPSVGVLDPDGYTADGRPVFDFTPELNGTVLLPGRITAPRPLRFTNPNRERFTYDVQVLAGLDRNPVFTTEPVTLVQAGRAYRYAARAADPDGQALVFSLMGGPAGATVDAATGDLTWTTAAGDVGEHAVRVRATDALGGFAEQRFTLSVRQTVQNRPPVITSHPTTDATVAGAWEVTAYKTGGTPTGIAVGNFNGGGTGVVSVNAGERTIGVLSGLNQPFRVGEQAPDGRTFQTGHAVDVGLPTDAVRDIDLHTLPSVVQADLNADGTIDLVTSAGYSINRGTGPGKNFLSVTLNNGDGTFRTPTLLPIEAGTDYSLTDTAARNLQVADLDGDGKADLLALSGRLNIFDDPYGPYQLLFWKGQGDGQFGALQKTTLSTTLQWIRGADMNGDGTLDLVGVDRRYDSRLGVMLGNGDGTFGAFTPTATYPGAGYNSLPALIDVDGKNGLDVVATSFSPSRVDVYMNDGGGNLSKSTSFAVAGLIGDGGQSTTAGDFNGDGKVDVAVTTSTGFGVWTGAEDGVGFTLTSSNSQLGFLFNIAGATATDVNGDGQLDLLYGRANSGTTADQRGLFVALGRGDGTFAFDRYALGNDTADSASTNSLRETAVLAGDYNRDGVIDLAVVTTGGQGSRSRVTVVDGVTPGHFAAPKQAAAGQDLRNALIGDVNSDGLPDVVAWDNPAGNLFSGLFRTRLGLGDGTFSAPQTALGTSGAPISALLRDVNNDGKLDLVFSYSGQGGGGVVYGGNQVALGHGDGTFGTSFSTFQGNFFYGNTLFTGDFNNDGDPDLMAFTGAINAPGTGTFVDGFYDIYLNNGGTAGTFTLASHRVIPVGTGQDDSPKSVAIADFDGDGKLDVVNFIQKTGSTPFKLLLLKGNGDGTLADPVSTDVLTANTDSVTITWTAAGDMNGDGKADLVTFGAYGQLSLFLGLGDGRFTTPVQYPGGSFPTAGEQFRLLDFDGDGKLDVVKIDTGPFGNKEGLSVRLGNGDGTLAAPQVFTTFGNVTSFSTGDLDGDGRLDVLATTSGGQATAYLGTKPGLAGVVTGDANGDGKADVLAVNTANDRVKVLLGNGNNTFNRRVDVIVGRGPVALAAADFNGDGKLDIVTANRTGTSVTVLRGDGLGGFTRADIRVGVQPVSLAVGDLTGDGKPDILVADDGSNAAYLLTNSGNSFTVPVPIPLGDRPKNVTLADVTGDGKLDAIFSLPESKRLLILPGLGNGTFGPPVYVTLPATPGGLTSGDFNRDGKTDLAVTLPSEGAAAILFSRGSGLFSRPQLLRVGADPVSIVAEDANGDGRLDLVVANAGDDTASVILNKYDPTKLYRHTVTATDPDGDPITFDLTDAPGGMVLNSTTGELVWAPTGDQFGANTVTIRASDGQGGTATQTFHIAVAASDANAKPVFTGTANPVVSSTEAFTHDARAVDADDSTLRYSLVDGPAGASIDPLTGKLTWDARGNAMRFNRSVVPGSGAHNGVVIPDRAELRPSSLTAEGWFQFDGLGNQVLLGKVGPNGESFRLVLLFGTLRAQVGGVSNGNGIRGDAGVTWAPDLGRWYHIALSFDEATGVLNLLVNGRVIATSTTAVQITYDASPVQIGVYGGGAFPFFGSAAQVRLWNTSRTPQQIQADMTRQVAATAPNLVFDYEFDDGDAFTILDSSANRIPARRISVNSYPEITRNNLAVGQTQSFTIRVEDGRGGFDEQTFTVTVVPPVRSAATGTVTQPGGGPLGGWVVFADQNGNGYRDETEPFATTAANGTYTLPNLLAGDYRLSVEPRAGFVTPAARTVTVGAFTDAVADFAVAPQPLGQIRGRVTTAGPAVPGWVLFLDRNDNTVRDEGELTATTDAVGDYAFSGVPAGTYTVRFDAPSGWKATAPSNGLTVTLAANGTSAGNDFTIAPVDAAGGSRPRFVTTPGMSAVARTTFRYAALAFDPQGRPLTYSLALAPAGAVINPATGQLVWTPSLKQVGPQQVIVKVANDRGGVDLQAFTVTVGSPNTAPLFGSTPPTGAFAGVPFRHDLLAQDAEQTALTFAFDTAPAGASIDANTGRLTWTPAAGQLGPQAFAVVVRDGDGGESRQSFTVTVANPAANRAPAIAALPRLTARAGLPYSGRLVATDADGDPLAFVLVSGPSGLAVSADGFMTWTPTAGQLGSHQVTVRVGDGRGGSDTKSFALAVGNGLPNTAPVVTSTPPTYSRAGGVFDYALATADADADPVAYQLLAAPSGLSLDTVRGTLRWQPAADQLGPATVSVRAYDPFGGATTQTFTVTVRGADGPPVITSVPPTETSVGTTFLYSVRAVDLENDPLAFELAQAPAGMTINPVTGEIAWTPTGGQAGFQAVIVKVSDGVGGYTTQGFAVRVLVAPPNRPPVFATDPPLFAAVGSVYAFTASAADPDGQPVTYLLRTGPAGMTVDATTGVVTWTPTGDQAGTRVVTLAAFDAGGAAGLLSYELSVLAENRPPVITGTTPTLATAGAVYRYDVSATDPDLDPLTYSLVNGPSGMSVDAFGRVTWQTTPADVGPNTATVRVSDPRGGTAERTFTVGVRADTSPPKVVVIPGASRVAANSPEVFAKYGITPFYPTATVRVAATDDVGVTALTATANGKPIALDPNGNAVFRFEEWGFGTIRVTATAADSAGNSASGGKSFAFVPFGDDPAAGSVANPVAVITSPGGGATTGGFVGVRGTATSDHFTGYSLSFRRADQSTYTPIAAGTSKVEAGTLAQWDTSLLENDEYVLRLEVNDELVGATIYEQTVGVSGNLKLGNFRLSFADMTIPVAGIPITLARTYDTLRSDRTGDLGYGWRLEYRNTNLQVRLPKTGLESAGIYTAFRPGTKVYLTLPGGERQGFTFTPDLRALPSFGGQPLVVATPRFTPDRGVTSTLSAGGGSVILNQFNELTTLGGLPWNPASPDFGGGYSLTLRDGTRYFIDGTSGLLKTVTDRNENTLTFGDSGIASSNGGVSVSFARDAKGRIVGVSDPAGNTVRYAYDAMGDLVRVTDRMGNETKVKYRTDRPHYLDSVIDPLGRTGARTEYDANGRLSHTSGRDTGVRNAYDPATGEEFITEADGSLTRVSYDSFGLPVTLTDALGQVTRLVYDRNGWMVSSTDPLGQVTRYLRDDSGTLLAEIDHWGRPTRYSYDASGNPTGVTDALGRHASSAFDSRGNLTSFVGPGGATTSYEYDRAGQVVAVRDALGGVVRHTYDAAGRRTSTTDALGHTTAVGYDLLGNETVRTQTRTTPGGVVDVVTTNRYDANGQLVATTAADGGTTTFERNATGEVVAQVDPLGRRTSVVLTAAGEVERTTFDDGTSALIDRDETGRVRQFTGRAGTAYRVPTDALGRPTAFIAADADPTTPDPTRAFEYDVLGRLTAYTDEAGRRVRLGYGTTQDGVASVTDEAGRTSGREFDALGRLVRERDASGRETTYAYDETGNRSATSTAAGTAADQFDLLGRLTARTDSTGRTTRFEYDAAGRLVGVVDAGGQRVEYGYDEVGNRTSLKDQRGAVTTFEYDNLGRLVRTVLPSAAAASYRYDVGGRLAAVTDFDGRTSEFDYDSNDRLVGQRYGGGTTAAVVNGRNGLPVTVTDERGVTRYTYDAHDRLTSRTDPDGTAVSYTYDAVGNRRTVTTGSGTTTYDYDSRRLVTAVTDPAGRVTRYQYDAAERLLSTGYANGVVDARTYDAAGRLATVVQSRNGATIASYAYTRDAVGRVVRVDELGGRSVTFQYDSFGRVIGETVVDPARGNRTIGRQYDAAGNPVRVTDSVDGETTYGYDAEGRLTTATRDGVTEESRYDATGQLVFRGVSEATATRYEWDERGRLVRVTIPATGPAAPTVIRYGYNYLGQRVSRTVNGVETRFLLDDTGEHDQVLAEYTPGGGPATEYVYGVERISRTRGGAADYFLADGHSGTRRLADAGGAVVGEYAYSAFGRTLVATDSSNPFLYRGEYRDPLTGLDHLRARNYDPDVGRFVSRDRHGSPPGDLMNLHRYQYAGGDPVNHSDPSGEFLPLLIPVLSAVGIVIEAGTAAATALAAIETTFAVIGGFVTAQEIYRQTSGDVVGKVVWSGSMTRASAEFLLGVEFGESELSSTIRASRYNHQKTRTAHHYLLAATAGVSFPFSVGTDTAVVRTVLDSAKGLTGFYYRGFGVGVALFASAGYGSLIHGRGQGYFSSVPDGSSPFVGYTLNLPNWVNFGAGLDFSAFGFAFSPTYSEKIS